MRIMKHDLNLPAALVSQLIGAVCRASPTSTGEDSLEPKHLSCRTSLVIDGDCVVPPHQSTNESEIASERASEGEIELG